MSVQETQYAVPRYAHIQISESTQLISTAFVPVYCIEDGIGGQNIWWVCQKSFSQVFEGF